MSSRFLTGLGAWLLGAVTATTGSMIAVNQLAHGLLDAQAQQVGGTAVNADFDRSTDPTQSPAPVVSASPTARVSARARKATHSDAPSVSTSAISSPTPTPRASSTPPPPPPPPPSPPPTSGGTLLVSADGSVMASCESAGAYLQYWSPDQGFEADDVVRGPAAVASVVFQNTTSSIVMRVSCVGGKPVAHIGTDE